MKTLLGLFPEKPVAPEQARVTPIREQAQGKANSATARVHNDQIHALVQQLFFRHELGPVRHVGFTTVETSTATAPLCLEVARVLAAQDRCDVALIDAHPDSVALQTQLQIPSPSRAVVPWSIDRNLWMVPRQSWLPDACGRVTDQNLSRLRELTSAYDFSILWCASVCWLTASIGQACDGLVLVLTASKTRRLVAAQIKAQLSKAQVPLLGTVLAERRFPVPQGLYRSL